MEQNTHFQEWKCFSDEELFRQYSHSGSCIQTLQGDRNPSVNTPKKEKKKSGNETRDGGGGKKGDNWNLNTEITPRHCRAGPYWQRAQNARRIHSVGYTLSWATSDLCDEVGTYLPAGAPGKTRWQTREHTARKNSQWNDSQRRRSHMLDNSYGKCHCQSGEKKINMQYIL